MCLCHCCCHVFLIAVPVLCGGRRSLLAITCCNLLHLLSLAVHLLRSPQSLVQRSRVRRKLRELVEEDIVSEESKHHDRYFVDVDWGSDEEEEEVKVDAELLTAELKLKKRQVRAQAQHDVDDDKREQKMLHLLQHEEEQARQQKLAEAMAARKVTEAKEAQQRKKIAARKFAKQSKKGAKKAFSTNGTKTKQQPKSSPSPSVASSSFPRRKPSAGRLRKPSTSRSPPKRGAGTGTPIDYVQGTMDGWSNDRGDSADEKGASPAPSSSSPSSSSSSPAGKLRRVPQQSTGDVT